MRSIAFAIVLAGYFLSLPHIKGSSDLEKSMHAAMIWVVTVGFLICVVAGW